MTSKINDKIAHLRQQKNTLSRKRNQLKDEFEEMKVPKQAQFRFMHRHKAQFSISLMAKTLNVSRSGYYKWLNESNL